MAKSYPSTTLQHGAVETELVFGTRGAKEVMAQVSGTAEEIDKLQARTNALNASARQMAHGFQQAIGIVKQSLRGLNDTLGKSVTALQAKTLLGQSKSLSNFDVLDRHHGKPGTPAHGTYQAVLALANQRQEAERLLNIIRARDSSAAANALAGIYAGAPRNMTRAQWRGFQRGSRLGVQLGADQKTLAALQDSAMREAEAQARQELALARRAKEQRSRASVARKHQVQQAVMMERPQSGDALRAWEAAHRAGIDSGLSGSTLRSYVNTEFSRIRERQRVIENLNAANSLQRRRGNASRDAGIRDQAVEFVKQRMMTDPTFTPAKAEAMLSGYRRHLDLGLSGSELHARVDEYVKPRLGVDSIRQTFRDQREVENENRRQQRRAESRAERAAEARAQAAGLGIHRADAINFMRTLPGASGLNPTQYKAGVAAYMRGARSGISGSDLSDMVTLEMANARAMEKVTTGMRDSSKEERARERNARTVREMTEALQRQHRVYSEIGTAKQKSIRLEVEETEAKFRKHGATEAEIQQAKRLKQEVLEMRGGGAGGGGGSGGGRGFFGAFGGGFLGRALGLGRGVLGMVPGMAAGTFIGQMVANQVHDFSRALSNIVAFNAELENTRLALAGSTLAVGQFEDSFGKVLPFAQQMEISLAQSEVMLTKVQEDAIRLSLPVSVLAEAFETAGGQARAAGVSLGQQKDIIEGLVILSQRLNIPFGNLTRTIDNVFSGLRVGQSTLGRVLNLSDSLITKWKQAGTLGDEIAQRLRGVIEIQEKLAGDTADGLKDRITSRLRIASANVFGGTFESYKDLLKGVDSGIESLVATDSFKALDGLFSTILNVSGKTIELTLKLPAGIERLLELSRMYSTSNYNAPGVGSIEAGLDQIKYAKESQGFAAEAALYAQSLRLSEGRGLDQNQFGLGIEAYNRALDVAQASKDLLARVGVKPGMSASEISKIVGPGDTTTIQLAEDVALIIDSLAKLGVVSPEITKAEEEMPMRIAQYQVKTAQVRLSSAKKQMNFTNREQDYRVALRALESVHAAENSVFEEEMRQRNLMITPATPLENRQTMIEMYQMEAEERLRRQDEQKQALFEDYKRQVAMEARSAGRRRADPRLSSVRRGFNSTVDAILASEAMREAGVADLTRGRDVLGARLDTANARMGLSSSVRAGRNTMIAHLAGIQGLERDELGFERNELLTRLGIATDTRAALQSEQMSPAMALATSDQQRQVAEEIASRTKEIEDINTRLIVLKEKQIALDLRHASAMTDLRDEYIFLGDTIKSSLSDSIKSLLYNPGSLRDVPARMGQQIAGQFIEGFIDEKLSNFDVKIKKNFTSDIPGFAASGGTASGIAFADSFNASVPAGQGVGGMSMSDGSTQYVNQAGTVVASSGDNSSTAAAGAAAGASGAAAMAIAMAAMMGLAGGIAGAQTASSLRKAGGLTQKQINNRASDAAFKGMGLPTFLSYVLGTRNPVIGRAASFLGLGQPKTEGVFTNRSLAKVLDEAGIPRVGVAVSQGVKKGQIFNLPGLGPVRGEPFGKKSAFGLGGLIGVLTGQTKIGSLITTALGIPSIFDPSVALGGIGAGIGSTTGKKLDGFKIDYQRGLNMRDFGAFRQLEKIASLAGVFVGNDPRTGKEINAGRGDQPPPVDVARAILTNAALQGLSQEGARGQVDRAIQQASGGSFESGLNTLIAIRSNRLQRLSVGKKIYGIDRPASDARGLDSETVKTLLTPDTVNAEFKANLVSLIDSYDNIAASIDKARISNLAFNEQGQITVERLKRGIEDATSIINSAMGGALDNLINQNAFAAGESFTQSFFDGAKTRALDRALNAKMEQAFSASFTDAIVKMEMGIDAYLAGDSATGQRLFLEAAQSQRLASAKMNQTLAPLSSGLRILQGAAASGGFVVGDVPSFATDTIKRVPGGIGIPMAAVVHGGETVRNPAHEDRLYGLMSEIATYIRQGQNIVVVPQVNVSPIVELDGEKLNRAMDHRAKHSRGRVMPNASLGASR